MGHIRSPGGLETPGARIPWADGLRSKILPCPKKKKRNKEKQTTSLCTVFSLSITVFPFPLAAFFISFAQLDQFDTSLYVNLKDITFALNNIYKTREKE